MRIATGIESSSPRKNNGNKASQVILTAKHMEQILNGTIFCRCGFISAIAKYNAGMRINGIKFMLGEE